MVEKTLQRTTHSSYSKIFAQFAAGIFGGTILGVISLMLVADRGGNFGCWVHIDTVTGLQGYESCGLFGAVAGMLVGSIGGVIGMGLLKFAHNILIGIGLLLSALLLPFLYALLIFEIQDVFISIPIILIFATASLVPSALITVLMALRHMLDLRRKERTI